MRKPYEIDHIDPKWEEGRDYQLVCGFDHAPNLSEREASLNQSKANRFLPWRVAKDEIGEVPVEQGDWCQFLDPDTGKWVLADFLGAWWYEKSLRSCGSANWERDAETRWRIGSANRGKEVPQWRKDHQSKMLKGRANTWGHKTAETLRGVKHTEERKRNIQVAMQKVADRKRLSQMAKTDPLCPDFDL